MVGKVSNSVQRFEVGQMIEGLCEKNNIKKLKTKERVLVRRLVKSFNKGDQNFKVSKSEYARIMSKVKFVPQPGVGALNAKVGKVFKNLFGKRLSSSSLRKTAATAASSIEALHKKQIIVQGVINETATIHQNLEKKLDSMGVYSGKLEVFGKWQPSAKALEFGQDTQKAKESAKAIHAKIEEIQSKNTSPENKMLEFGRLFGSKEFEAHVANLENCAKNYTPVMEEINQLNITNLVLKKDRPVFLSDAIALIQTLPQLKTLLETINKEALPQSDAGKALASALAYVADCAVRVNTAV